MLFNDISYLQLCGPFCSEEYNHLCNLYRGHYAKHLCEIILNLDMRCHLKIFLVYNSGGHFVLWSRTICALFGRGYYGEHSCEFFCHFG